MSSLELAPSISSTTCDTARLQTHLFTRDGDGATVVFVHGNASSARFFEQTMAALPAPYRALAPDLRGFGDSQALPVDATRGLRDFADDLHALLASPDHARADSARVHLVGWSVGGGVVMQYAIDHPEQVASLTLINPVAPYGFGGTKDATGTPCWADFAGSGGGTANPEFVQRLRDGDDSSDSDLSPRNVLVNCYFKPPFRPERAREDLLVTEILKMALGDDNYPGDLTSSENWPTVAPGKRGVNNALAPCFLDLSPLRDIENKPPILWLRGADDVIVSDASLFDFGNLGQLGAVPGWPGADAYPAQPMVAQTRALLDDYRARGGDVAEQVIEGVGHSPHIEAPEVFMNHLTAFLGRHS